MKNLIDVSMMYSIFLSQSQSIHSPEADLLQFPYSISKPKLFANVQWPPTSKGNILLSSLFFQLASICLLKCTFPKSWGQIEANRNRSTSNDTKCTPWWKNLGPYISEQTSVQKMLPKSKPFTGRGIV